MAPTYNEVFDLACEMVLAHPELRAGQAAVNALWELDPSLGEELFHWQDRAADPFYDDNKLAAFSAWLHNRLEG